MKANCSECHSSEGPLLNLSLLLMIRMIKMQSLGFLALEILSRFWSILDDRGLMTYITQFSSSYKHFFFIFQRYSPLDSKFQFLQYYNLIFYLNSKILKFDKLIRLSNKFQGWAWIFTDNKVSLYSEYYNSEIWYFNKINPRI